MPVRDLVSIDGSSVSYQSNVRALVVILPTSRQAEASDGALRNLRRPALLFACHRSKTFWDTVRRPRISAISGVPKVAEFRVERLQQIGRAEGDCRQCGKQPRRGLEACGRKRALANTAEQDDQPAYPIPEKRTTPRSAGPASSQAAVSYCFGPKMPAVGRVRPLYRTCIFRGIASCN
jgi:hypothetical protein